MSLSEIDRVSLDTIETANRVLDAWQEAEATAHERARKGRGKK